MDKASGHVCAHTELTDDDGKKLEEAMELTCTVISPTLGPPGPKLPMQPRNSVARSLAPSEFTDKRAEKPATPDRNIGSSMADVHTKTGISLVVPF